MPYEWEFETSGRPLTPLGQKCHRGPMIDVEVRMSKPFSTIKESERIRQHLLEHIVSITSPEVQTREVVLRTLNSPLGAIFQMLIPLRKSLQVTICEKRNSLIIDEELKVFDQFYFKVMEKFPANGVAPQYVTLITDGLKSNSAIMRVASRCAIVLMTAYIEWLRDNA